MKIGLLFVWFFIVFTVVDARKAFLQEKSAVDKPLQATEKSVAEGKDLDIKILNVSKSASLWLVEVEITNKSDGSLFMLSDPRTANGEYMAYVSSADKENSTLNLSVQFFTAPSYFLYVNATRVKLTELMSNTSYTAKYSLGLPLHHTLPPYGDKPSESVKIIDTNRVRNIQFSIGVLPSDEGIRELLISKKSDPFFNGYFTGGETIEKGALKGKRLLDVQTIFRSSYRLSNSTS